MEGGVQRDGRGGNNQGGTDPGKGCPRKSVDF